MSDLLARLAKLPPEKRRLLEQRLRGEEAPPEGIRPRPRDGGPVRLSFAQERLWLIDRLDPGRAAYNVHRSLRIRGGLDPAALERALTAIVRRHESLRTRFPQVDGEPVQVVEPARPVRLPLVDLGGLEPGRRADELERLAAEESRRPFDLAAGPLLRAAAVRLDADEAGVLFTLHHVVSDGWSMGVLVREVSTLYGAFARGEEARLPELPVQYADYALWQRERLSGELLAAETGWWRERLAGAPALLELPTDRPRPAAPGDAGAWHGLTIGGEVSAALHALSRREGATPFMALLAAWQLLLARYAGQDDVLVGTPVAGRERLETEGLIGFFVNTLVLRADLSGDPTFGELLRQVRADTLGAFRHQELPFEKLVEELGVERSLAHTPIFQVMFVLQNNEQGGLELGGAGVETLVAGSSAVKLDLTLSLWEEGGEIRGGLAYRSELWDAATMERMAGHYLAVLEAVAASPETRLSELELLGGAERRRVLEEWSRAEGDPPAERCIHRLFEAQAKRTPDAVALVAGAESLGYAALDARADRLAGALRLRGVGPDVRVGVCLERGVDMVAAVLAVLKAGGAYVPLDPDYPRERLAYMLADSGARVLLTQAALADRLPLDGLEVVLVAPSPPGPLSPASGRKGEHGSASVELSAAGRETLPQNRGKAAASTPPGGGPLADASSLSGAGTSKAPLPLAGEGLGRGPAVGPDNLAYVIYTSGSTGAPKGVAVPHGAAAGRLASAARALGVREGSRLLSTASLSFDASVLEVFLPLVGGATLHLADRDTVLSPEALERLLRERAVDVWVSTPVLLGALPSADFPALRVVSAGGERLSGELAARWADGRRMLNLYGPTETTVFATLHEVRAGPAAPPIGRPAPGSRAYVLDARGRPAPVGVPGELHLGGAGLARGYLGRPGLTAERFVPDAFSGVPGARLYRTGDRARWLASGELEYLGRLDEQVKVRGFRIEPGEIETVLRGHPGVDEVAVVVREDAPGERRLVAYVAGDAEAEGLREHARRSLPDHMVPGAFVRLDRLPLTPGGKLDRRALPAPEHAAEERYVAPRTPTEEVLAGIWADVLRLDRVGVADSFFELGGHSLVAARVVARIRDALGVELPLRALFEAPTVASLAARVEAARQAGAGPQAPPLLPLPRDGAPLPASFAQTRLWFIQQMDPASSAYNMSFPLRLFGALDVRALRRALTAVVRRHEALRTTLEERGGEVVQAIHPTAPADLPTVELRGLSADAREREALRLAEVEARRPFDLARGPLLRTTLLRLADEDAATLFTLHHVVSDGWSMDLLVREVSALYAAELRGEPVRLPELPVQYADYAAWQRAWLSGAVLEEHVGWWRAQLAGAPAVLELPTDRPRPAVPGGAGAWLPVVVKADVAAGLRALSRREGATPFMTLLAAWQLLLARCAGQDDVLVGTPVAGRGRLETEGLIGLFVNTLVLRAEVRGEASFRDLLRQVRERTLGAYQHQEVPFEKLVEELGVERSLAHTPLFQALFTLRNDPQGELRLGGTEVGAMETGGAVAKFDLVLSLEETEGEIRGGLEFRSELWDAATMERLADAYVLLLEAVAADPGRRILDLPLTTEAERGRVLREWGVGPAPAPVRLLHERFAEQAARTPDAPAVVHGDATLDYAGLAARAGVLADELRARGVGPETRVGVCMERGVEAVVALLGALGAGGVYVPLDPAYPADRLAFMLADSGAALVLTQERYRERIPQFAGEVVALDGRLPAGPTSVPDPDVSPENLAWVVYTSGSTGQPKGVMVSHAAAANLLAEAVRAFGVGPGSRVVQTASLSFDASLLEIFLALHSGGALHVADRDTVLSGEALEALLRERDVDLWVSTPPLLESLGDAHLPALRSVSTGGERCSGELAARWSRGRRLMNMYGPTETTVYATWHLCRPGEAGAPPIGRPVAGARGYVLDPRGEPVPAGFPGELYVGGAGLARGYLERPGLTAERFVPDAHSGEPGARLYRTGDRVRWRASGGELEYLGRVDDQVKVRGLRIEPGEIEAALRRHPGVGECVVVAREDARGERRLVAYVVGDAAADGMREHLRRSLPEYMVPGAFVVLDRLPLTPAGKLDRRALPAPGYSGEGRYVAPRTAAEEVLAGIWADVLRLETVGVVESFFELGGHSLLATRVVSRVREVLGVELPLRALFEAPTVAALAERVETARGADAGPQVPPLLPLPRDGAPLPASFAQTRLWFIQQMDPVSSAYNMSFPLRLSGALDARALRRAMTAVVRRHEALRTTLEERGGEIVQVIHPPDPIGVPTVELRGLSADAREREAVRLAQAEARRPFDLARGPLLRTTLLRLADEDAAVLFTLHHVVSDGWSMDVLVREVSALYAAELRGEPARLPELPVQYADYAAWQRAWLSGAVLEEHVGWWRAQLADAPTLLELPTDRPRPAAVGDAGGQVAIDLAPEIAAGLRALVRREGATLFMALLAAWQLLLARYSGQDDVLVGTPIAGRNRLETERLIGFFVNTLVLRADLSGDPAFTDLLGRVQERTLGAYQHQDLPFEKLVEELGVERSLAHTPLVQVLFALQNNERGELRLGSAGVESLATGVAAVKFDLALSLAETGEEIHGTLAYRSELWEAATVERMAGHYLAVLAGVASAPHRRLSDVELLGAEERRQVLEAWNRTEAAYPSECAHQLFEAQAERTPDAPAVFFGAGSLGYAELDRRADRLAHHLRSLGVGLEARVGVALERGPELVAAVLAVLKAGGAYVPLDPSHPGERLAYMLADSGARVLLTQSSLADRFEGFGGEVVLVDTPHPPAPSPTRGEGENGGAEDGAAVAGCSLFPVPCSLSLAYVIYTSGSTGRPKGVLIQHGSLANLLAATREAFGVRPGDVMPVLASSAFDIWLFETLLPLTAGAAVRLVERERVLDVPAMVEEIVDATLLHAVPALMRQVAQAERERPRLGRLRRAFVGGDLVPADLLAEMRAGFAAAESHVLYGPTEGTVLASAHPVPVDGAVEGHPIGAPLGNVRLYVCDPHGNPQPAGVPGELRIGGAGVARGYLGRPGLTAERFVPDPFGSRGSRLYRTGDRARRRADGVLEFLGRIDQQVKVRGFRIEPGEIEARLAEHAAVRQAVVDVREDAPGERRLVAYVVGDVDADTLREHLRERLPEYMVPGAFVVLDRLPLTPNGKLDRRALPAPEQEGAAHVGPRTPTEEVLAGIWAEVLGQERVGVAESFFALGGHSLLAMRVVSRVREVFGVELPVRALFEAPGVAGLAERVEALRRADLPALPPVVPAGRGGALPLSFAQERLWFLDRLEPGSAFYNVPMAVRLRGPLDASALERALGEIVRRHEALRTAFPERNGGPVQEIAPFRGFALPVEDLSGLDDAERDAEVRRRAAEDAAKPFDLAAGPLFRLALLRLADGEHVLLACMHHIVSDEWSMGVLLGELSALYAACREGGESPLPELPVQYADYAVWQREHLSGEALEGQMAYWRERLAGAPALLELPTDRARPAAQTYHGAHEQAELSRELLERLTALGRGEGATLFMTLLAAWQVLLSKYAGTDDVVVGSPVAGRTRREVEGLIGFFLNTLVLRTDLGGAPSFREVLRRVRGVTLGAYEHQEVPFERLVEDLQPQRSLGHAPLFQVMFALKGAEAVQGGLPGVEVEGLGAEVVTSKFDLTLSVAAHPDGLGAGLEYNTDLFERGTVRRMLEHLERVLEQAAADPDLPLSELGLLGDDERRQIEAWNRTAAEYPADRCVHHLFEAQAERTPDAVAVTYAGGSLTYRELDRRAERLAHHLRGLGVGPDARVALCLERGPEMMTALLGILKAGAAYVPLDPAYPQPRLAYMLEDSGARVLLTQRSLAGQLPEFGGETVVLDGTPLPPAPSPARGEGEHDGAEESAAVAGCSLFPVALHAARAPDEPCSLSPDNLAFVIYTSGSTGWPKGVAMPHRPLVNLLAWQERHWRRPGPRVTLQFATISFDASFHEVFSCWSAGGRVVLIDEERRYDPAGLLDLMEREGVERAFMPAVALQHLAEEADRRGAVPSRLAEVQTAGEALRITEPMRRWFAALGAPLHNHYGPTETHVVTASTLDGDPEGWPLLPDIGGPIANSACHVLDGGLAPLPVGVPGELYLGGACLARGYLGRPELTAEKFVPDPFSGEAGARMYRTGDRVRWLATGALEFLGRTDAQVKLRGFRIEPGEIEAVLEAHAAVREAVVEVRGEGAEKQLVAYVVAAEGSTPGTAELREHARGSLPEHMVPGAFVVLERLPLTPSGKVDRRALPAPEYTAEDRYVAPRTPTEEALAGIWAEVLHLERVGVMENFFELGGHSLRATRVVSGVREVFGIELPLRALFEAPTVARLAERVEAACGEAAGVDELAAAMDRLDQLSDEEIRELLEGAR
jgi:amino acid adenylation domain-containing protein